jgi:large subunit ribosomal protein L18
MADKHKERAKRALRRKLRVRGKLFGTAEVPRLTVTKSLANMFVQVVDDQNAVTLAAVATNAKSFKEIGFKGTKTEAAKKAGEMIARIAKEKGIEQVIFDRNKNRYHGRVKAVAEGAREGGLKF